MNISDTMIHINESLTIEQRSTHLLLVAFVPEKTSSMALLNKARSAGYTAQLVGA